MKIISGKSISNVKGFKAAGCATGLKKNGKKDMALIYSEVPAVCAATFTTNVVKAAPVLIDMEQVKGDNIQALIINSGNANACTGEQGMKDGYTMIEKTAEALKIKPENVMVYSTGVIGQPMPMDTVLKGIAKCKMNLVKGGNDDAQKAIMTTDTKEKMIFGEVNLTSGKISICGIAKGSGMIHPNMATMLSFIVTDAAITKEMLTKIHSEVVPYTFNMVTVDGDMSTNDSSTIIANGAAGNPIIDKEGEDFERFQDAVYMVQEYLAKAIAADGEGATRLMEVNVVRAEDEETARICAKSVCGSSLVKSAVHGADANWGRILAAMGYSGAKFDPDQVSVSFRSAVGDIEVFKKGVPLDFDEDLALKILTEKEIFIDINMGVGFGSARAWGCDLSEEYVVINGSYRS